MAQRDIAKIDKTILDNFYKLVHTQPNVRLTAASSTFKILNGLKKSKTELFNENLNYSVDRLVAGLASSRALARRGYGTLLLELLKSYQISTERLFTIAHQKFGQINKESTRDNLLGYFILISIVLESSNYKKSKANAQYLEKIYKYLTQLVGVKSYLEIPVSKLLVDYYHIFHPHMIGDINQQAFGSDYKLSSIELLTIVLCNKKEPIRELLSLDNASLMNLCRVLSDEKFQKRPLHPVFTEVTNFIVTNFPHQFQTFYSQILVPTFFKANHNELAAMGLEFTAASIKSTDDTNAIKILLSDHVVRILILSLRSRNSLYAHCTKFVKSLKEQFEQMRTETNEDKSFIGEKQYIILQKLTSSPGSIAFDEDSKSSTINDLLQSSSPSVLKKYLDKLMTSIYKKFPKDERHQHEQSCARQIAFIVRRPQLIEDQSIMTKVARFLLFNSMIRIVDIGTGESSDFWAAQSILKPVNTFDDSVISSLKIAYHSTLEHIVSACNSQQRLEQLNNLVDFSDKLISYSGTEIIGVDSEQTEKIMKETWPLYKEFLNNHRELISKQREPKQLYPITTLFLFYGLQIIEHGLECKSQFEELAQCSDEVLRGDPKDGSWADILTDQIIAILSATECSSWIRKLCESVFGSLLPHISQTSIDLICDAIKSPICDDEDVDDEEDMDDEEGMDDEEMSDEEMDDEEMDDEENSSVSPLASSEKEEKDDDVEDESIKSSNVQDDVDEDDEDDIVEGEYPDDEHMMKLDAVLADMFKLNRIGKKKSDPTFRLRCLDLVKKIVVKKHNDTETINTILATIIPLATSSRKTKETRPVADKIIRMLSKMPGKSKYPKMVNFLEKNKPLKA